VLYLSARLNIPLSEAMSGGAKRQRFLFPNRVSELVWDSESEDTAGSESTSEDERGSQDEPGLSHLQSDRPTSSGKRPVARS